MFRNPFVIEYRKVGIDAKEYAVNLTLTETEKHMIDILGVGRAEFITERHLLRAGLLRSAFNYFERTLKREEVGLANHSYYRNLDEHFSSRPGMDTVTGGTLMIRAFERYQAQEPVDLAKVFFISLVPQSDSEKAVQIPGLVDLMESYIKEAVQFLKPRMAKLK